MLGKPLTQIDENFWSQKICDGNLYLKMGPKSIRLFEAGQVLDQELLSKYKNSSLFVDKIINQDLYDKYIFLFNELKTKKFEKDQRSVSKRILSTVFQDWMGEGSHPLTFAKAAFDSLNFLPYGDLLKFDTADSRLFKKALYSGAILVVSAMSNEFFEFNLIKDLYQVTFCFDIGLCDKNYSYHLAFAVDSEALIAGGGLDYLNKAHASIEEKKLFLSHPQKSFELLDSLKVYFTYPELIEVSLYQHETATGSGFPRGITKREVSTWDAVCLFADGIVSVSKLEELEKNIKLFILLHGETKQDLTPTKRVFFKFKEAMSYFETHEFKESIAS